MLDNVAIARRYIQALASGADADALAEFLAPDVVQEEFPNRLLPHGATRDLAALQEGRRRGRALMRAETYDVLSAMAEGDRVAIELIWTGTVGAAIGPFTEGQQLRARFAIFLDFRGGRIVRQHNYDCFWPWD
ncbi:MAG: nuclear transport factor 2 family protein [Vicinamibacteria bacterium]